MQSHGNLIHVNTIGELINWINSADLTGSNTNNYSKGLNKYIKERIKEVKLLGK